MGETRQLVYWLCLRCNPTEEVIIRSYVRPLSCDVCGTTNPFDFVEVSYGPIEETKQKQRQIE